MCQPAAAPLGESVARGVSGAQLPECPGGHQFGFEGELSRRAAEVEGGRQHHVGPTRAGKEPIPSLGR